MWRGWDEYQRSESGNKPLRQGITRCSFLDSLVATISKSIGCLMCPKHQTLNCMTVQDSVRVSSVSLGVPRYHCASPKNKKQTNTKSMWGAWYGLLGFVLKPLLKKNNYEIPSRTFKFFCINCNVSVWLHCTDCGCLESATRMRNDSDPVHQTNLGLTSLYSLLFLSQQESYLWIDYP